MTGHTDCVNSVAFSHDGQWIVSGSDDCTICVWNVTTRAIKGVPLTGHTDWVNSVAFSHDGQQIVFGSFDHTIRMWNVTTGTLEGTVRGYRISSGPLTPLYVPSHRCRLRISEPSPDLPTTR